MKMKLALSAITLCCSIAATADEAMYTERAPVIDGIADDITWQQGQWYDMHALMLGEQPTPEDFSGRYTLRWDQNFLYLLAEIQDDHLSDTYADPLERYWDDDCLEIFIDADKSGGDHLNNYNAFAYHVALDNQVVDIGPLSSDKKGNVNGESKPRLFNDHVESAWRRQAEQPHKIMWETAIKIYGDDFQYQGDNVPMVLKANMKLGFMLAYCDADGADREHFVGSHEITPVNGDKNRGYIDASVFGELTLIGKPTK